jgi:hypothetical protein
MRITNCIGAGVARVRGGCTRWLAVAAIATAAVAGAAAIEAAQSVEITDPAGDVLRNNAQPWQDIVGGQITREGDTFTFSMEMAAALPAEPEAPSGGGSYFWDWGIEVDPALAPEGWPFPKSFALPHEFLVGFLSDGEEYSAFVTDRRPLLVGQEPIITLVPYSVDGATIEVFVDADLLDNLSAFGWRVGSHVVNGRFETQGHHRIDGAPNAPGWVPWPEN